MNPRFEKPKKPGVEIKDKKVVNKKGEVIDSAEGEIKLPGHEVRRMTIYHSAGDDPNTARARAVRDYVERELEEEVKKDLPDN